MDSEGCGSTKGGAAYQFQCDKLMMMMILQSQVESYSSEPIYSMNLKGILLFTVSTPRNNTLSCIATALLFLALLLVNFTKTQLSSNEVFCFKTSACVLGNIIFVNSSLQYETICL